MTQIKGPAFAAGLKAISPLAVAAAPIGFLFGVAVKEAANVGNFAGWSSSVFIMAGASQFAALDLLDRNASIVAVMAAVVMINARHIMYSAALQRRFATFPLWFRLSASYLLIDQVFALNSNPDIAPQGDQTKQIWFYLGTGLGMTGTWMLATTVGLAAGDVIPSAWELDFAIPLMFLGLMVLSISNRPGLVAAAVGATVAVVGRSWPSGTELLLGALLGVVAGGLAESLGNNRGPGTEEAANG